MATIEPIIPERQCIVTRESGPEDSRLRFARSPDGEVVPDLSRKLPGRGVWVTLARDKVAEAVKRQAFKRGFEEDCKVDPELSDRVGDLLRQQAVSHLSLARKAGAAVAGFTKVEELLRKGKVKLLLHAPGSSADGAQKLDRLAKSGALVSALFLADEMDLAFGRANVIHAAVAAGGLADRLVLLMQRVATYENLDFPGR